MTQEAPKNVDLAAPHKSQDAIVSEGCKKSTLQQPTPNAKLYIPFVHMY